MKRCATVLTLVFAAVVPAWSQSRPAGIQFHKDIVYGKGGDVDLHLDIAQPSSGGGPYPAVVCVHGGAWVAGHRGELHGIVRYLAQNGYVASTITYRLAPKDPWPAQIEDVRCAVRFLRANARKYNVDPNRIAVLGASAGGHLSLLAGLMQDGPEGKGGHADESSKVQAVVNYFGPTDFRVWTVPQLGENLLRIGVRRDSNGILKDFLGTSDRKAEIMAIASPVANVHKKAPPVLTFHGTLDCLVPDSQARILHDALKKADVPERLEILEGAPHGWTGAAQERTNRITVEFLNKHLTTR